MTNRCVRRYVSEPRPKWKTIYFQQAKMWDITNDAGDKREEHSVIEDLTEEHAALIVRAVNRDDLFDELVAMIEKFQRSRSVGDFDVACDEADAVLAKAKATKE